MTQLLSQFWRRLLCMSWAKMENRLDLNQGWIDLEKECEIVSGQIALVAYVEFLFRFVWNLGSNDVVGQYFFPILECDKVYISEGFLGVLTIDLRSSTLGYFHYNFLSQDAAAFLKWRRFDLYIEFVEPWEQCSFWTYFRYTSSAHCPASLT